MDARTTLSLLLFLMLLLPPVQAQCEKVSVSEDMLTEILKAVYTEDGYFPFQTITVIPTDKERVERNSMVIVDPLSGKAYDVILSDTAVDPNETLLGNVYGKGPFAVSLILYDTLRFAKPDGYGDGPYLRERFEGRFEHGSIGASAEAVLKTSVITFGASLLPFIEATKYIVESREPIKNRVVGENFVVSMVCASEGCRREIYSLLMKYMNIGASSEMIVELGGFVIGSGVKYAIERWTDAEILSKLEISELKEVLTKIKLGYYKTAHSLYESLPSAEQDIIKKILSSPEDADILIKELSPKGRKVTFALLTELEEKIQKLTELLKSVKENPGKIKEIEKDLGKLEEELSFFTSKVKEGPLAELKDLKNQLLSAKTPEEVKVLANHMESLLSQIKATRDSISKHVPILASQYEYIKYGLKNAAGIESTKSGSFKGLLTRYTLLPVLFYVARAGPTFFDHPIYSPDVKASMESLFPIRQSYELPAEWKYLQIVPLRTNLAVVDVLINNGSDPGDLFKSFLTITGVGMFNKIAEITINKPLFDPLVISKDDERFYSMKPAIVTVAVDSHCENCSFTRTDNGISFVSGSTTFLSVTENSKPEEGSTAIVFFRKANLYANGEKVIDMTDTENSCMKKCVFLRENSVLKTILPDDPAESMFLVSLFVGVVVPTFTGLGAWGPIVMAYPLAASLVYKDCFSCVDTTFGYYIHLRSLGVEVESVEDNILDTITASLEALGIDTNNIEVAKEIQKNRLEKKQVMVYARFSSARGSLFGRVLAEWSRPENTLPTGVRESKVVLEGENNLELDYREDVLYGLSVPDTKIPGIIVPTTVIKVCPESTEILRISSSGTPTLSDSISTCLTHQGINLEQLGKLVAVVTDTGSAEINEDGIFVMSENWSGKVGVLWVDEKFQVHVQDVTAYLEGNRVEWKREIIDIGHLRAIVFENGSFVYINNCLYLWLKDYSVVPKEAVAGVNLSEGEEGINVEIVPSPEATPSEAESIEQMNEALKNAKVLDATRMAVAIVKGPDGKLYLRIYDKEKNTVISEEILDVLPHPEDPTALLFRTVDENGEVKTHTVKVEVTSDGTPVLKVDGESGGILRYIQTPEGLLFFDPETGEWRLINGVLAPLAEAFKNGIKMTFEGGLGVGTPSGGIVINTGGVQSQPMTLPLFSGWEVLLLLTLIPVLFVLTL